MIDIHVVHRTHGILNYKDDRLSVVLKFNFDGVKSVNWKQIRYICKLRRLVKWGKLKNIEIQLISIENIYLTQDSSVWEPLNL